uniref:Uncharacterized protein n=1 Tax=Neogobius melanostomus TaxID=47308 RepID=A0A8C6SMD5_9GOBI
MASFVLAGKADCPFFAKAEYLADKCQNCLPDFSIKKIRILPEQWTCETNGWTHEQSPLIWRHVGLGNRGILLGGLSDFLEHCQAYYNVNGDMSSEHMLKISEENMAAMMEQVTEEQEHLRSVRPLHVWICSALSPVAPLLISQMLQDPEVLPESPLLSLHLLHVDMDQEDGEEQLRALQMETEDLAAPRLHQVSDSKRSHTSPRGAGPEVRALLWSHRSVNQKCSALLKNCPGKRCENFITVATHLENHARVRVATKLHVRVEGQDKTITVTTVTLLLWGDVCGQFYVDTQRAQVYNYDRGITAPSAVGLPLSALKKRYLLSHASFNRSWCEGELQRQVCEQQGALCCAHAVLSVLKAWDSPGTVLSAGVYLLQLPEGLVLSLPVRFSHGSWTFLSDLTVSKTIRDTLLQSCHELKV